MLTYGTWMKSDRRDMISEDFVSKESEKAHWGKVEGSTRRYEKARRLVPGGQDLIGTDAGAGRRPPWSVVLKTKKESEIHWERICQERLTTGTREVAKGEIKNNYE